MSEPPCILQVNTADIRGGAEKISLDLHRAYLSRGVDSRLAVGHPSREAPGVVGIPNEPERSAWARGLGSLAKAVAGGQSPTGLPRLVSRGLLLASDPLRYRAIASGVEDFHFPATTGLLDLGGPRPDVLHLHNLHGYYFDLRRLPQLSASQPTILTMHDPWLLTGHCAHPIDCPRWRVGCGACPDLGRYVPIRKDASAENFAIKRKALSSSNVLYATPSQWLMDMATESGVLSDDADARVIPNGIDVDVFSPGDRAEARGALGLAQDAALVLFAAHGIRDNPFKDFATLTQALELVGRSRGGGTLVLVALGDDGASYFLPGGAELVSVAFTDDPVTVAAYYRAADLYVHSARAENLPLAVIEAMACGTPVVASRVGGIPEIVNEGETGLLVEPGDAQSLAAAIEMLLADDNRRHAFAEAGVARIRERFTLARQADAYLDWYRELTAGR